MRTGVVIVEDDRAVRENLAALINMDDRLRLLGAFGSAEIALRDVPALQPALAVMDINLPRMNGIELVRRVLKQEKGIMVVVLTVNEDEDTVFDAVRAGAMG
ncbi:MAG TPA: response regulator transcription factor, partial [Opitutaceae bacterium]|nr:response regulator transcription factor [Opitutaceae bacterium]